MCFLSYQCGFVAFFVLQLSNDLQAPFLLNQIFLKIENNEWLDIDSIPSSLKELFAEVGKVYAPALIANAKALENGDETWETEIDGVAWSQKAFPYQAKCLKWIREEFEKLSDKEKAKVLQLLEGSGCEVLIN